MDDVLPDWLTRCAENRPGHLAVQCGQEQWSFAELHRRVTRLARQLATFGVREGDRVALLAANGLAYVTCVHAMTRLRAILVPLNTRLSTEELQWQVCDVRARFLINDAHYATLASEIGHSLPDLLLATLATEAINGETMLSQLSEADIALHALIDLNATQAILYTSGTTGTPKGAIITYGMQWWNAIGSALNLGHRDDDRWLACLPLFHIGGLSILMRSVIYFQSPQTGRERIVLLPPPEGKYTRQTRKGQVQRHYGISVIVREKFDPIAANKAICEDKVSMISVVAVMLQRMLSALGTDTVYPSTLRCVLLGGGPAPRPLLEECMRRNIPVIQTYGLTESCSQAVTLAPADALRKLGSAGRPLLPVQLRILHNEQPTSPHEPVEIFLKGPTITPGYVDRPDATAVAFSNGWFATGDIGYLDDEGYLYVLDRRSDLIISGGENVYPAEIEAVLMTHPDVLEAGVCGRDDREWGQVPIAFIRMRSESTVSVEEVMSYVQQRLARYKQPRAIYLADQLPRTSSGKLLRRKLWFRQD